MNLDKDEQIQVLKDKIEKMYEEMVSGYRSSLARLHQDTDISFRDSWLRNKLKEKVRERAAWRKWWLTWIKEG